MRNVLIALSLCLVGCSSRDSSAENKAVSSTVSQPGNDKYSSRLLKYVDEGNIAAVQTLIDKKANLNVLNGMEEPILSQAIKENNIPLVKCLVQGGADVNLGSRNGVTPIMEVILNARKPVPKKLETGETVYIEPNGSVNTFLLDLLVSAGADVNCKDISEKSPIGYAAELGNRDGIDFLMTNKADVNVHDVKGVTPLMSATKNGHIDVVRQLLNYSADLNATDGEGQTALIYAAQKGYIEITRLLIDKGASVNVRDHFGSTALKLAKLQGHQELVSLLEKHKAVE